MTHKEPAICPACGRPAPAWRNPLPTVDVIIHAAAGRGLGSVVLIERANPPLGWALPGGFIEEGESAESAARREALEETGLEVALTGLAGVYSEPGRDPRHHTLSVVYAAQALDPSRLAAGSDAARARLFPLDCLPPLAFDHGRILDDFIRGLPRASEPTGTSKDDADG